MDFNLNTDLTVQRTLDVGYILKVLTNPEIFDAISEDGFNIKDFKIDVINDYWVEIIDGDIEVGVIQFKQMFNKCLDSHIHIFPEHRRKYSQDAGSKILEWVKENLNGSLLYTAVPVFCKSVRQFLLSFDFNEIGILEKSWLKNGIQNDMWILTKRVE